MSKGQKLYVGNIPFTTDEHELRELFGQHGPVYDVKVITDRETGRSRGFAFVTMDEQGAQAAIEKLNGLVHGGRQLTVNEAKEREQRGGDRRYDRRDSYR